MKRPAPITIVVLAEDHAKEISPRLALRFIRRDLRILALALFAMSRGYCNTIVRSSRYANCWWTRG